MSNFSRLTLLLACLGIVFSVAAACEVALAAEKAGVSKIAQGAEAIGAGEAAAAVGEALAARAGQ